MNNKEAQYLIEIIKNVLNNKKTEYKEDIDYVKLYRLAAFHTLLTFLYVGLKDCTIPGISVRLQKEYNVAIYKAASQEAEKEIIITKLEENKIKHMPLKGSILKYLYPSIDLRTMCDFDCLFDASKAKEVKKIMIDLGYEVEHFNRGNHDVYMKKPFMNVEMHRELMNDAFKISKYYKTIWNNVIKLDNKEYEYKMSNEDFYIFMICHLAKHFTEGGAGIRNFIDVYLFTNEYKELNFDYINTELDKLGLTKFSNMSIELSQVWFGDKESNELIDSFSDNIINSGTYGTIQNQSAVKMIINDDGINNLEESKSKYMLKRLFPSFENMKRRNPILKKIPILLPWFYFTRLLKGLFHIKDSKVQMDSINNVSLEQAKKINDLHKELEVKDKL